MSGKLLIVDDVATNRLVLKVKLSAARYDAIVAENSEEARALSIAEQPDLILMDVMMPDVDGIALCKSLKEDPATADIPIILFTALNDNETRLRGLRAGADDFLAKPIDEVALLARVRSLLRMRDQVRELRLREDTCAELGFAEGTEPFVRPAEVMLIAKEIETAQNWETSLETHLGDHLIVADSDNALRQNDDRQSPDLFVIEIDLEDKNAGLRLMADLRSRAATRHAAIIVVLPEEDSERAATALDLGAADICYTNFDPSEMAVRIRAQLIRKRRADRLRATLDDGLRLAITDPLTGLYNRRYGLRHLSKIAARARSQSVTAGVIMVDVDHFKAVNDTHGHLIGDMVLRRVAQEMRDNLRSQDLVCRIGGEEFLVLLPDTNPDRARSVAERLRAAIAGMVTRTEAGTEVRVTLSMGVADLSAQGFDIDGTLAAVDRALYAAKKGGRNAVTTA